MPETAKSIRTLAGAQHSPMLSEPAHSSTQSIHTVSTGSLEKCEGTAKCWKSLGHGRIAAQLTAIGH